MHSSAAKGWPIRAWFGRVCAVSPLAWLRAAVTAAGLSVLAAPSQAGQASSDGASWWRAYLSGSRSLPLPDGRRINLYCEGHGGPVVIMEAGLGSGAWSWRRVQHRIAATARVCVYDRAGYFGRSSPASGPRSAGAEADDLAALVKAARIPKPYVLVGHSYGGHIVRLFAYRHPGDVAGLVLVDPSAEYQEQRLAHLMTAQMRSEADANKARTRRCATEATRPPGGCVLRPAPGDLPPDLAEWFVEAQDAAYADTMRREDEAMNADSSAQLVGERRSLGDVPVVLLQADPSKTPAGMMTPDGHAAVTAYRAIRGAMLREIVDGMSSRATLRQVPGAGHRIQDDQSAAVIAAVNEVVATARRK